MDGTLDRRQRDAITTKPRSLNTWTKHLAATAHSMRSALSDHLRRDTTLSLELQSFWRERFNVQLSEIELVNATAPSIVLGQIIDELSQSFLAPSARQPVPSELNSLSLIEFLPENIRTNLQHQLRTSQVLSSPPRIILDRGIYGMAESVELFLAQYDSTSRRSRGAYFTPCDIAHFVLRSIDERLQVQFDWPDGLAQDVPVTNPKNTSRTGYLGRILDPAAGSGIFLLSAVELVHSRLHKRWTEQGVSTEGVRNRWNEFVHTRLVKWLVGYEVIPSVALIANDLLTLQFAQTGFSGPSICSPIVRLHNALAGPPSDIAQHPDEVIVVVGNPPFSGISQNNEPWIRDLLRGLLDGQRQVSSYYEVDGQPLGERKVWLQDDYVKFFRFAQWLIEAYGAGVLGLVTNHAFLENASFRGMRESLMETFSEIALLDLHGSRKKHEMGPHGTPDENVFDIEQGIAISVGTKLPAELTSVRRRCHVTHGELWGTRKAKLAQLQSSTISELATVPLKPKSPNYFLYPQTNRSVPTSKKSDSQRLVDIMPFYRSAVVTARDRFVIDPDREQLLERMSRFRNLSIPDADIRQEFFGRSRARTEPKYPPGDTRGWKLSDARRRVAEDTDWQDRCLPCSYRPWDTRWIYWAKWMVDWPRPDLTQHIVGHSNQLLIARRQTPRNQPCNYFWTCTEIAMDGVIRSDSRGNESVFPLYLHEGGVKAAGQHAVPRANFDASFIERMCNITQMQWCPTGQGDLLKTLGPTDLLAYIYATFYSSKYRTQFAEQLATDYPHVLIHRDQETVIHLCQLGQELLRLHQQNDSLTGTHNLHWVSEPDQTHIPTGYPRYTAQEQRTYINDSTWVSPIAEEVWNYRIGIHQVCHKWLKDRRGRRLSEKEFNRYLAIVTAIVETLQTVRQIDSLIDKAGGW